MLDKTIEELLNEGTLAATATVPASPGGTECSILDTSEVAQLALQAEAEFHASATEDVVFHFRASAEGGTVAANWDTVDYTTIRLPCDAGARVQVTKPIWPDPLYITALAVNEDATYAATNVKLTRTTQDVEPT